jgi:hypothetical protein
MCVCMYVRSFGHARLSTTSLLLDFLGFWGLGDGMRWFWLGLRLGCSMRSIISSSSLRLPTCFSSFACSVT